MRLLFPPALPCSLCVLAMLVVGLRALGEARAAEAASTESRGVHKSLGQGSQEIMVELAG